MTPEQATCETCGGALIVCDNCGVALAPFKVPRVGKGRICTRCLAAKWEEDSGEGDAASEQRDRADRT